MQALFGPMDANSAVDEWEYHSTRGKSCRENEAQLGRRLDPSEPPPRQTEDGLIPQMVS